MDKMDWEKAKELLALPYGSVRLAADGYVVTLQRVPTKDMFRSGIIVYVNGRFKGEWLFNDCEERRRFVPQKTVPVMSRKGITAYNKATKSVQRKFKKLREAKRVEYGLYWTNWNALVKHFETNNQDVRLMKEE